MELTIRFLTTILLVIVGLTTSFATNAVTQEDVVTFTIPKGYRNSLYGLCRDINMPIDTIIKYNPLLEHGLSIGASISLPANYVDMELLTEKGFTPSLLENAYDVQFSHLNNRPNTAKSGRASDLRTTTPKDTPTPVMPQVEAYCYDVHSYKIYSIPSASIEKLPSLDAKYGGAIENSTINGRQNLKRIRFMYWGDSNLDIKADELAKELDMPTDSLYHYALEGLWVDNRERAEDPFVLKLYETFFTEPYPYRKDLIGKAYTFIDKNGITQTKRFESSDCYLMDIYIPSIEESHVKKLNRTIQANAADIKSKIKFASNLESYRGDYSLSGFGFGHNSFAKIAGKAFYYYIANNDGSRTFEGPFQFVDKRGRNISAGFFKNNRQVGLWVWVAPAPNYGIFHCEINFNENGVPDGGFKMTVRNEDTLDERSFCSGTFVNGKLEYLNYKDYGNIGCNGRYKNGHPIGEWKVTASYGKAIIMQFSDDGTFIKGGYRDNRTGDWIDGYSKYPNDLINDVYSFMKGFFYRSTSYKAY